MISAIVLAAGTSSRMGEPKPLLPLDGRPLLDHVLRSVRASRVDEVVVVLGHDADRVRAAVALDGVKVVENPEFAEGMSTSLRAGVRTADPATQAFLVVLADQPFLSSGTIDALMDRRARSAARILLPTYRGVRGNPVLVDGSLSAEIAGIAGDQGCRAIFKDHPDEIEEVAVSDPGILIDVDTPEDLARLRSVGRGSLESLASEFARRGHVHRRRGRGGLARPRSDVLALAHDLRTRGEAFALATVVRAERPTSGKPGMKAIVRPDREVVGWVGGSCAEAVLVKESLAALRDGRPRLLRVTPSPGPGASQEGVVEYLMECASGGAMDLYIEPHMPKPRFLIVGDSPVAEALSSIGRLLDYRVTVVAPKATAEDFPDADEVHGDLDGLAGLAADAGYAVVATMGKYDVTALRALLAGRAAYVGLVASRRRAEAVREELRRAGASEASLGRIRSPAGVDVGARTPEEIAVSIAAEVTQVRRAGPPTEGGMTREPVATRAVEGGTTIDAVCGMEVDRTSPLRATHEGRTYVFCSDGCRERFLESPGDFVR